jgi:hypothetical protein
VLSIHTKVSNFKSFISRSTKCLVVHTTFNSIVSVSLSLFYACCCKKQTDKLTLKKPKRISTKEMSLITGIYYGWRDLMDNKSDQRTTNWLLMSSPLPTIVICLSYVYIVKVSVFNFLVFFFHIDFFIY